MDFLQVQGRIEAAARTTSHNLGIPLKVKCTPVTDHKYFIKGIQVQLERPGVVDNNLPFQTKGTYEKAEAAFSEVLKKLM